MQKEPLLPSARRTPGNAQGAYRTTAASIARRAPRCPPHLRASRGRPCTAVSRGPCPTEDHPGTPILHVGKFSRGLGRFSAVEHQDPAEKPDEDFPFLLTTGRVLYHYHTGTMTRRSKGLRKVLNEELMEINPHDAKALKLQESDLVKVSSRRGEVKSKVRITDRVPRGVVFMTFHFKETAANLLTSSHSCPTAKIPELKVTAVRVEKA